MALLGFEGFDGIGGAADLILGPLNSVLGGQSPAINTSHARLGAGNCLALSGGTGPGMILLRALGKSINSAIVGAALITISGQSFIGLFNGTTCQVSFSSDASGVLRVYRGLPSNGVLLAVASQVVIASIYNFFELQATIGTGTSGSIVARVNSNPVVTLVSVNASADGTPTTNQVGFGTTATSIGTTSGYLDDIYLLDLSGAAPYNTFLGDVHVTTLFPSADVGTAGWTPSSGVVNSNWQEVSETAMDSDTSYNISALAGQTDQFATAGLTLTPSLVFGVQVKLAARLDNAGADQIAAVVTSNSIQQIGAPLNLLTNYSYVDQIFLADPNTAVAWTAAGVNAASFGYTRVS
jgi:hypothetical protein